MAYIKIKNVRTSRHLKDLIVYAMKPTKTKNGSLVTGIGTMTSSGQVVYEEFMCLKQWFHKTDGRQAYQIIQSFPPEEVSYEKAHEISVEFAKRAFPDAQMLICTHADEPHPNTHIIINSVSPTTGLKFRDPRDQSELTRLRKLSDQVCREHCLSVIENPKANTKHREPSFPELKPEQSHGRTIHSTVYEDFDAAIQSATSLEDF